MRKITGLRRRALVTAAMATALGGIPALGLERGHSWIAFLCIGLQIVLLTMAVSFLVRAKRAGEPSPCDSTTPIR